MCLWFSLEERDMTMLCKRCTESGVILKAVQTFIVRGNETKTKRNVVQPKYFYII